MKNLTITGVVPIPDNTFESTAIINKLKSAFDSAEKEISKALGRPFEFSSIISTVRGPKKPKPVTESNSSDDSENASDEQQMAAE